MLRPGIKFDGEFWARMEQTASAAGYASVEEFVRHVLEKELDKLEEAAADEEVKKRLKGLGYLE
jgi:hypothetical protein